MSINKSELKFLLEELKKVFITTDTEINVDSDPTHVGSDIPEDENAIWFDIGEGNVSEFTYENPIITELFSCIRTLQDQVQQLQADVEYLKLTGGGSITPKPPEDSEENELSTLLLEDGSSFLLEDGTFLLLENSIETIQAAALLLETGAYLLLEDGGTINLE